MRVALGGCAAPGIDRVVAIVVAAMRRDRVACDGGLIPTPNIDRPAADRERPKALAIE